MSSTGLHSLWHDDHYLGSTGMTVAVSWFGCDLYFHKLSSSHLINFECPPSGPSRLSIWFSYEDVEGSACIDIGTKTKLPSAIASQPFCKWPRHEHSPHKSGWLKGCSEMSISLFQGNW